MSLNRFFPSLALIASSAAFMVAAVAFTACAEDPSAADQADQGLVGHHLVWQLVNVCAASIGVAPDDTIWIVGCDTRADGDIWYMRMVDDPSGLGPAQQAWTLTKGQGRRITVDDAGQGQAITSTGTSFYAHLPDTNARTVVKPSGDWDQVLSPSTCVSEKSMYHLDNLLVFETSNLKIAFRDHHFFALRCPTSRGNGVFMHMFGEESAWTATTELAQSLALFTPSSLFSPSAVKVPWILDSSGVIKAYVENPDGSGVFVTMPSPPTLAFGLTDHYALASDGVYEWIDAEDRWARAIDNFTPTGAITQIAKSGAVTRQVPSGQFATFGPSHLWGIDTSGVIYSAIDSGDIR
jgi:hypothetical protein